MLSAGRRPRLTPKFIHNHLYTHRYARLPHSPPARRTYSPQDRHPKTGRKSLQYWSGYMALNVTFSLFFSFFVPLALLCTLGTSVWWIRCRSRTSRRLLFEAPQRPSGSSCRWNKGTFLQRCKCIRCTHCCRYSEHFRNQLHSGLQQYVPLLRFPLD